MEEIKINEIKETQELNFTQEDILNALLTLDEETRSSLMNLNYAGVIELANNEEYLHKVYQTCDDGIRNYQMLKESVKVFIDTLEEHKRKGVEHTIDVMIENYKGFSREEKLEFNKKWLQETNIENSLDNFKYTWNKFMETLSSVAN